MKCNRRKTYLAILLLLGLILSWEGALRFFKFTYYPVDPGLTVPSAYTMFQKKKDYYRDYRPITFKIDKPGNEYRIFFIGGSSVANLGGLYQHKNRIQMLQEMLQEQSPELQINIINLGYPSWGTNRLLLLFKEILAYEPDLFIIYSGHNEFEEEYMQHIFHRNPSLLNINNQLLRISKIYQLLSLTVRKILVQIAQAHVTAVKKNKPAFPPEVNRRGGLTFNKNQVYTNYTYNLDQMARLAKNAGVPIIFSTVAYNRRTPPQAPTDEPRLKHCEFLASTNKFINQARECFEKEVSDDLQPRRASRETNQIVKNIASFYHIPLADIDATIVAHASQNIPGNDLFNDRCHLNEKGNQILIETLYQTILSLKNKIGLK